MKRPRTTQSNHNKNVAATTTSRPRRIRRSFLLSLMLLLALSKASRSFPSSTFQSSRSSSHHNNNQREQPTALCVFSARSVARYDVIRDWAAKTWVSPDAETPNQPYIQVQSLSQTGEAETQYEQRKAEWANRYTNLESLRETFGSNRNKVWGDLDAPTTRRLYKTLLPKALLELVNLGVHPEDLAPLAYQARVAAKLYARERCQVPSRMAAVFFDGFRQLKRYGKFQTYGMSYQQVWEKYHQHILDESDTSGEHHDLTEEDVTAKICLKILERSCVSNEHVDRWVFNEDAPKVEDCKHLQTIVQTLESDVRRLLDPVIACQQELPQEQQEPKRLWLQQYKTLRLIARARRGHFKSERRRQQQQQQQHPLPSRQN